jgi:hypothetical protein
MGGQHVRILADAEVPSSAVQMGRWALVAAAALCMGCRGKQETVVYTPPATERHGAEPGDPDVALHEQLRAGSVQMDGAASTLEEVREAARRMQGSLGGEAEDALGQVLRVLDGVGAVLTDLAAPPPTLEEVQAGFASADDRRKQAISDGNDAYFELGEALGDVRSLEDQYPDFIKLSDLLSLAQSDVAEAVEAFGGRVEKPEG